MKEHTLSEKWIKASIAGTMWAASEIVLGSFLHNLKIPFSGNILTAIGLILLISISYIWTDKGIFWRAGLICALMKTMSPSAVIFGPMLAITAESLLLELSVKVAGRTVAGYAIGAMLAMSWNLFQKIFKMIIFYGSNIIDVYTDLLKMAQKQLDITTDIVWLPIIILLIVYALFGLVAAIIGIRVGRRMLRQPVSEIKVPDYIASNGSFPQSSNKFDYSITWLVINILLMIGSFFLLITTSWIVWSVAITIIVIIWSVRYKRALRQLSKPKFWILFVVITLLTAFVFTKAQPGENALIKGLMTGVQMNFRAVLIIIGFSVLGAELYNPVIRNYFSRTSFRNLPLALELSAESLPLFIASIPDFKSLVKNPVSVFYQVIAHADRRLEEIKGKEVTKKKVFIVTGPKAGGKTTYIEKLIEQLKINKIDVAGILSKRVMKGSETTGYDLMNIQTGNVIKFLRQAGAGHEENIGKFMINESGLTEGREILISLAQTESKLVIIDEVGLLEIRNDGWAECIDPLIKSPNNILMAVRDKFVEEVIKKWNLDEAVIINIEETDFQTAVRMIAENVSR